MQFEPFKYRETITERLRGLSPIHRRYFATWCLQEVFEEHRSALLTEREVTFIGDALAELWTHVWQQTKPSDAWLSRVKSEFHTWNLDEEANDPDFARKLQLIANLDVLASEVFMSDGAWQAMLVAESVINCIDFEEDDKGRTPRIGEFVPEIATELRIQEEMLQWLESSPALSVADLRRLRNATAA